MTFCKGIERCVCPQWDSYPHKIVDKIMLKIRKRTIKKGLFDEKNRVFHISTALIITLKKIILLLLYII